MFGKKSFLHLNCSKNKFVSNCCKGREIYENNDTDGSTGKRDQRVLYTWVVGQDAQTLGPVWYTSVEECVRQGLRNIPPGGSDQPIATLRVYRWEVDSSSKPELYIE